MSNGSPDLVHATAQIVASYVGNPSPTVKPDELIKLFQDVHSVVVGSASASGRAPAAAIEAPAAPAALPAPAAAPAAEPSMPEVAAASLRGSVVHAGGEGGFDPEQVWPNASPTQRRTFERLIEEHNIPRDINGRPVPRKPVDKLVSPMTITDPIGGRPFTMLKRHLSVTYGIDINDLRAMFFLPEDFPVTAPGYSESKRIQASEMGLGTHRKKKVVEEVAAPKVRGRKKAAA